MERRVPRSLFRLNLEGAEGEGLPERDSVEGEAMGIAFTLVDEDMSIGLEMYEGLIFFVDRRFDAPSSRKLGVEGDFRAAVAAAACR